jgi:hypothetical protein
MDSAVTRGASPSKQLGPSNQAPLHGEFNFSPRFPGLSDESRIETLRFQKLLLSQGGAGGGAGQNPVATAVMALRQGGGLHYRWYWRELDSVL